MITEQQTIDGFTEAPKRKRPILLIILVVLSGLYISSNLYGVTISLMNGPLTEDGLDEKLSELYKSVASLKDQQIGEDIVKMAEVMIESEIYTNNEAFYLSNVLAIFTLIIGAIGVFLMFNGRKLGFHIYIIYSLLPIITMYLITPMALISTILVILSVIISATFALLYGLNLKYMK